MENELLDWFSEYKRPFQRFLFSGKKQLTRMFFIALMFELLVFYCFIPLGKKLFYSLTLVVLETRPEILQFIFFVDEHPNLFFNFDIPQILPSYALLYFGILISITLFLISTFFPEIGGLTLLFSLFACLTFFNSFFFMIFMRKIPYYMNGILSFYIYLSFSWWSAIPVIVFISYLSFPIQIIKRVVLNAYCLVCSFLFCLLRYVAYFYILLHFSIFYCAYFIFLLGAILDFFVLICCFSFVLSHFKFKKERVNRHVC